MSTAMPDLYEILFSEQPVAPTVCDTQIPCDQCPRFDECSFRDDRCRTFFPQASRDLSMFAPIDVNMGAIRFDYHTVYGWQEDGWGA